MASGTGPLDGEDGFFVPGEEVVAQTGEVRDGFAGRVGADGVDAPVVLEVFGADGTGAFALEG